MRNRIYILLLVGLLSFNAIAQQPVNIVEKFGIALQKWCNTDEIEYHLQAKNLASGEVKCLVDDKITQDAVANDQSKLLTNGTQEIASYLNIFQDAIMQGQKYEMSNVKARTDFVAPTVFKNEIPPSYVSADITLNGKLSYNITDIFYVRNGKITKIIDFSSDTSLGKAIELYSKRRYDEAFKMFRKLAYADYGNFDAQYYMVVMEIKKQGCDFLDSKVRDKEIAWFVLKNALAKKENAAKLLIKYPMDENKLDYVNFGWVYKFMISCRKPVGSGLMMSFNKKTKLCGFVNESGKLVIPQKYKFASPFHEERSFVISDVTGKCGFIDKDGNEAVPIIYEDAICDFYKGRTWCVKDGDAYLVDNMGKVLKIIPNHPSLAMAMPVGKYAALNKDEKIFDIYDYDGNLCYENYTYWAFDSTTGIVRMRKDGAPSVEYKVEW